jgi:hypothetical protein
MKPEISWSIMHPTALDVEYMSRVIKEAENYEFDSFEICGPCHHSDSGLDGMLDYGRYQIASANIDAEQVIENRKKLNTIVDLAHSINKEVLYWHREVIVPEGLLKDVPDLLDENGEFDLLCESFAQLMRYKIESFFEAVPTMDGLVLTLTEADYSVIHNSAPDKYPATRVVEQIVRIFAEELQKRRKRFVLRSFGSIPQDYQDIIDGAKLAAKDFGFEIETKITPFDFVPFLPENPFLYKIDNCTLSAECDCLGEFLGAGFLPAANVKNIVRYVKEAKNAEVDRFVIRLDRVGNNIFDTYEINLFAYHKAITENLSPEQIWNEWADLRWNGCRKEMIQLWQDSYNFITKTNYIDKNVIFHLFPPNDDISWLKLGGIFALFSNNKSLERLSGIWSIMADSTTPGRDAVLQEKSDAVNIAEESLKKLNSIKDSLTEREFTMAYRLWNNAVFTAKALECFCKAVCGYFEAMEAGADNINALLEQCEADFDALIKHASQEVLNVYLFPLKAMTLALKNEFAMERAERTRQAEAYDLMVCGALTEEWRTGRYQHGSKTVIHNGRLGRQVGNRVFPNGFIDTCLASPSNDKELILRIEGAADVASSFRLTINGESITADFDSSGVFSMCLKKAEKFELKLEKSGAEYPVIHTIALYA